MLLNSFLKEKEIKINITKRIINVIKALDLMDMFNEK